MHKRALVVVERERPETSKTYEDNQVKGDTDIRKDKEVHSQIHYCAAKEVLRLV